MEACGPLSSQPQGVREGLVHPLSRVTLNIAQLLHLICE